MGVCGLEVDRVFLTFPTTEQIPQEHYPGHFSYLSKAPKHLIFQTLNIFQPWKTPAPPPPPAIPLLTPVIASPWEPWHVLGPPGFSYSGEALPSLCLFPAPLAIPTSWPAVCLHLKGAESSGGQRLTETNASLPGGLRYTVVKQPPNLDHHTGRAPLEEHLAGP